MANTGILLRKDNKQTFVGEFLPQEGEMVFAQDTFEIGMMVDGELFWQPWLSTATSANYLFSGDEEPTDVLGENTDKYIQKKDLNGFIELIEFKKENGSWRRLYKGATQDWLTVNLEVNNHNETYPYLGKYNYKMQNGYTPSEVLDVATKNYLDNVPGVVGKVTLNGTSPMDVGYVPSEDGDVVTLDYFESGVAEVVIPNTDPSIPGALWNDQGVLRISMPMRVGMRVWSSQVPTPVNLDIVIDNGDGSWTVGTKNNINTFEFNYDANITKIEVFTLEGITSLRRAFSTLRNMEEFICPFEATKDVVDLYTAWHHCESLVEFPLIDTSNVVEMPFAWNGCNSLTSFPLLDTSKVTNCTATWQRCESLVEFPLIDTSNVNTVQGAWWFCFSLTSFPLLDTSNVVNFGYAWQSCIALTSFPSLNVSNGNDFSETWRFDNSLPHCPAGNEVTIPNGAVTYLMCSSN